jgi:hypothetical protein
MKKRRLLSYLAAAILCSLVLIRLGIADGSKQPSCKALDESTKTAAVDYLQSLDRLYNSDCLGGERDSWRISQVITEKIASGTNEELADSNVVSLLKMLQDSLAEDAKGVGNPMLPMLMQPMDQAKSDLMATTRPSSGPSKPDYWQYKSGDLLGIQTDMGNRIGEACADTKSAECKAEYDNAKQVLQYAKATERTLTSLVTPVLSKLYEHVKTLDTEWQHYFQDARSQFWWEMALNSWTYERYTRGKEGLQPPPDHQIILIHPNIGYEYVRGVRGERYKEALVLEAIGYNTWSWTDEGEMKRPLGISLIASFSDRSEVRPWGYGVMLHYNNNLSLGVTRHAENTGIVISLDLAKLFLNKDAKTKDEFRFGQ